MPAFSFREVANASVSPAAQSMPMDRTSAAAMSLGGLLARCRRASSSVVRRSWCAGLGAQVLARRSWRAGLGAQVLARRSWRAGLGAQVLARRSWRAGLGAQVLARRSWRAGLGAQVLARRSSRASSSSASRRASSGCMAGCRRFWTCASSAIARFVSRWISFVSREWTALNALSTSEDVEDPPAQSLPLGLQPLEEAVVDVALAGPHRDQVPHDADLGLPDAMDSGRSAARCGSGSRAGRSR